jgi:phosphate transport system substrate-binding protein
MKKTYIYYSILFLSVMLFFGGCKRSEQAEERRGRTVITIKGSDTMVNLAQKWAEVYMQQSNNISIQVTGGGSGTGVAALLNGTTNIATSSRELKKSELDKANQLGKNPVEYEVAMDGLAVIVHPDSKVEELTLQQVMDLFTGKIRNWKELGGDDLPITLYGRENSSGTYEFFRDYVLKNKDFAVSTQVLQGTAALGEAVARDRKGTGYGGVGYFAERDDVKILKIKQNENSEGIAPAANHKVNYEAIWDGSYSISRYLYCYTDGQPSDEVQKFIDFILSQEGQDLVRQMEYIPMPEKK